MSAEATAERSAPAEIGSINRAAPIPYYAQLAQLLRERIAAGEIAPGDPLPAEADLGRAYGLSRTVVRQALDELAGEGIVVKGKGRRTLVASPKVAELVVQELRGFLEEMSARGHAITTRILAQRIVPASRAVADALGVALDAPVVLLERVRAVNGEPVVAGDSYLPAARFERLAGMDLARASLYDTLSSEFGVRPSGGWRRIESVAAHREAADQLGVPVGAPALRLTAVTRDRDGSAFEYFRALYRGDRTAFEIRLGGDDAGARA